MSSTHWLKRKPVNERQAKWLTKIQDLIFDINYVLGTKNVWSDLLSRPPDVEKSSREQLQEHLEHYRSRRLGHIRGTSTDSSDAESVSSKRIRKRTVRKKKPPDRIPLTRSEKARIIQEAATWKRR